MSKRTQRCVHIAATGAEAENVEAWLIANDIPAQVINRISVSEVWVIDPEQAPRAIQLLNDQELQRLTRTAARQVMGSPLHVVCEECGTVTTFPPEQAGTVQNCPHCGAYVDVSDNMENESEPEEENEPQSSNGIRLPPGIQSDAGE